MRDNKKALFIVIKLKAIMKYIIMVFIFFSTFQIILSGVFKLFPFSFINMHSIQCINKPEYDLIQNSMEGRAEKTFLIPGSGTYDISNMGAAPSDNLTILFYTGRTNVILTGSRTGTGFTYIVLNGSADVTLSGINVVNNSTSNPFIIENGGSGSTGTVIVQGTNTIKNANTNVPLISAIQSSHLIIKGYTANSQANYLNVTGHTTIIGSNETDAGNISVSDLSITVNGDIYSGIGTMNGTAKDITVNNVFLKSTSQTRLAVGAYNGSANNINVNGITINSGIDINVGIGAYCNNSVNKSASVNSILVSNSAITSTGFISIGIGSYYYTGTLARVTSSITVSTTSLTSGTYINTAIGSVGSGSTELSAVGSISATSNIVITANTFIGTGIGGYRSDCGSINVNNAKIKSNTYMQIGIGSGLGKVGNITVSNIEMAVRDNSTSNKVGVGIYQSGTVNNIYLSGTIDIENFPIFSGFVSTPVVGNVYINSGNFRHVLNNTLESSPIVTVAPINNAGESLFYYNINNLSEFTEDITAFKSNPGYTYSAINTINSNVTFNNTIGVFLPDRFINYTINPENSAFVYPSLKQIILTFERNIQLNPKITDYYQIYELGSDTPLIQDPPTITNNMLTLNIQSSLKPSSTYTITAGTGIVQDIDIGYIKNIALVPQDYVFNTRALGSLKLSVPDSISFGTSPIRAVTQTYKVILEDISGELGVTDDREYKSPWKLFLFVESPLHNSGFESTLSNSLKYRYNGVTNILSEEKTKVFEYQNESDSLFLIVNTWYQQEGDGLYLEINPGEANIGIYTATLVWSLEDTP